MPTATLGFPLMCIPPTVLFLCLGDNWLFYILDWHLLRGFMYKTVFSHGGQRKLLWSPHLPVSLDPIKSQCTLVGDSCLDSCLSLGREGNLPQPGRVLQAVATQPSHRRGVAALRPGKRKEDLVTLQGIRACRPSQLRLPVASWLWAPVVPAELSLPNRLTPGSLTRLWLLPSPLSGSGNALCAGPQGAALSSQLPRPMMGKIPRK